MPITERHHVGGHPTLARQRRAPSMNCDERGEIRYRLRAYLPIAGGHGRQGSRAGGSARTPALNANHARQAQRRLLGRSLTFPARTAPAVRRSLCAYVAAYWTRAWMARREAMNKP